jgi:Fur family ferric uptake transcriptional regulator
MHHILEKLKEHRAKLTKARKLLINIFQAHHLPLTEAEIRAKLKVNKTTVYRELELFSNLGIVKEVFFGDGKKRFELNLHNHHHHLICTNCEKVEDIFVHKDVEHVEQKIRKLKNFVIKNHSLEFFGLCKNCSNNLI